MVISSRRKRSAPTPLQRKLIIGLTVYLGLIVAVGLGFALQKQRPGADLALEFMMDKGMLDLALMDQIILEMAEIKVEAKEHHPNDVSAYPPILELELNQGRINGPNYSIDGLVQNDVSIGENRPKAYTPNSVISEARLNQLQGEITNEDRMRVFNMVLNKLSAEDVHQLLSWSNGGITPTEKEAIKKLLLSRLSPEEIAEIRVLYVKYQNRN